MTECDAAPARLPLAPARKLTGCGAAAAPTHAWWYTYLPVTGATPIVAHPVVLTPFNYFKRYCINIIPAHVIIFGAAVCTIHAYMNMICP